MDSGDSITLTKGRFVSAVAHPASPWAAFAALLLFHLCVNLWWLHADNHAICMDEETQMLKARDYYEALFVNPGGDRNIIERLAAASKIEPSNLGFSPTLQICGCLMAALFGYSVDVLAATNTVSFLMILVGIFLIARRFLEPWEAVFAAAVTSFTPALFAASRFFMPDYLLTAVVVWLIYALLKSGKFQNTYWVFAVACLAAAAMLCKLIAPFYFIIPCAVTLAAGFREALRREDRAARRAAIKRLAFHVLMALMVSLGLAGTWYFRHVDRIYLWSSEQQTPLSEASSAAVSDQALSETGAEASATNTAVKPGPANGASRAHRLPVIGWLLQPSIPWQRYPVLIINSGMFLTLFLLGCVGFVIVLTRRRYRTFPVLLLMLWLMGSWILLTIGLQTAVARYALPYLPPLSLLAGIAVLSVSTPRTRYLMMFALGFLCLFQYALLTFHSLASLPQARIALPIDKAIQAEYGDSSGIYVWKNSLVMGESYAQVAAPTQDNFRDRIIFALLKAEEKRLLREGNDAPYVRLNMPDMTFDERHVWPDLDGVNPFLRKDIPPELMPIRRLKCVGSGTKVEEIKNTIKQADYVVYAIESSRTLEELQWQSFLENRGYDMVDRFGAARVGSLPARFYGVYSKRTKGNIVEIRSQRDLDKLSVYELYAFIHSSEFSRSPDSIQAYVRGRFDRLAANAGTANPVNDAVSFIAAAANFERDNRFQLYFIFRVDKAIDDNFGITLRGKPTAENLQYLPVEMRGQGYMDWSFDPDPPTMDWPAGQYVVIKDSVEALDIPYQVSLGFNNRKTGDWGKTIELGWIDFRSIRSEPIRNK